MKKKRKTIAKINFIYFIQYFSNAFSIPFFALFLKSFSYDSFTLGLLLRISSFSVLFGNLFCFLFFKKKQYTLNQIFLCIQSIFLFLFPFIGKNIIGAVFSTIGIFFCGNASFQMSDGFISYYYKQQDYSYSNTRFFGSLGYFLSLLFVAFFPFLPYSLFYFISAFCTFILFLIFKFFLPKIDEKKEKNIYKDLFSKPFVFYFLTYSFVLGSFLTFDSYFGSYLHSLTYDRSVYSYLVSFSLFIEVLTLFFLNKFYKGKRRYLLVGAFFLLSLRFLLFSFSISSLPYIVFLCALRGLGWGTFLFSHMDYFSSITKTKKTTGLFFLSIGQNLIAAFLHFFGGILLPSYSIFFLLLGILSFLWSSFFLFVSKKKVFVSLSSK